VLSAHRRISRKRSYQSHCRDKGRSFTQGARRDLWERFLYINIPALIPQTRLSIRYSYQVYREKKRGSYRKKGTEFQETS